MDDLLKKIDYKKIYVRFPRDDMENHKKTSGLKYYLIVMYLRAHADMFGEVTFNLDVMMSDSGYNTRTRNKKSYDDFRKILKEEIIDKGYATTTENILKAKATSLITLTLSNEKSLFDVTKQYTQISIGEYLTIVNSNGCGINKATLFGTYLFIKQFIPSRYYKKNPLPRVSYPSKSQIADGIGVSQSTVERAIKELVKLQLIYVAKNMYIEDSKVKGKFIPTRNVYTLSKADLYHLDLRATLEKLYGKKVYSYNEIKGKTKFL